MKSEWKEADNHFQDYQRVHLLPSLMEYTQKEAEKLREEFDNEVLLRGKNKNPV